MWLDERTDGRPLGRASNRTNGQTPRSRSLARWLARRYLLLRLMVLLAVAAAAAAAAVAATTQCYAKPNKVAGVYSSRYLKSFRTCEESIERPNGRQRGRRTQLVGESVSSSVSRVKKTGEERRRRSETNVVDGRTVQYPSSQLNISC